MAISQVTQSAIGYQSQALVTHLPQDITLLFLLRLHIKQISFLERSCRYFHHLMNTQDQKLWQLLCRRDFPRKAVPLKTPPKTHYQTCFKIEQNWTQGRYAYQRLSDCGKVLSLSEHLLFCVGPQLSIQIWNLNTLACQVLQGFPTYDGVDTCIHDDAVLICGAHSTFSGSSSFKVWNKTTRQLLWSRDNYGKALLDGDRVIISHQYYNRKLLAYHCRIDFCKKDTGVIQGSIFDADLGFSCTPYLAGTYLFAQSRAFIKYWNKNTLAFVHQIGSAANPLFTYKSDGQHLICGFRSGTITILTLENGAFVRELIDPNGEIEEILAIETDEKVVLAVCGSCHIACWDKASGMLLYKIRTATNENTRIKLEGSHFILGFLFTSHFELRDTWTGAYLKTCTTGHNWFRFSCIDDRRIFTLAHGKLLKIWDKQTGDLLFELPADRCKVFGDRLIVQSDQTVDVGDFSANPEIPFPYQGQLPVPPKS